MTCTMTHDLADLPPVDLAPGTARASDDNTTYAPTDIERLYRACESDMDYAILDSLCVRAGLYWSCQCGDTVPAAEDCGNCGASPDAEEVTR